MRLRVDGWRPLPSEKDGLTRSNKGTNEGTLNMLRMYQMLLSVPGMYP